MSSPSFNIKFTHVSHPQQSKKETLGCRTTLGRDRLLSAFGGGRATAFSASRTFEVSGVTCAVARDMSDTRVDRPAGADAGEAATPTTTISTISLQSGDTRLVIALLQSGEWLQLKLLEATPDLACLGADLQEALQFQAAHNEVLLQLQSKQSPVEELLRQADQLISDQRPRAEVYAAMAQSLGLAWQDVNSHLQLRRQVLDLNVAYHSRADAYEQAMRAMEAACRDTTLPLEAAAVKDLLTTLHELRRESLETLVPALQEGQLLLDKLRDLANKGTVDSRPGQLRNNALHACTQVEVWMENLHDRRKFLEVEWKIRKEQLEQCLAFTLLAKDLRDLEVTLDRRQEELIRSGDLLGDSVASAELLLHEHQQLIPEAKNIQDHCVKVTKATEQLASSGHFACAEAIGKAYSVLNKCTIYFEGLEQREALLENTIAFYKAANIALIKLQQLDSQLKATEVSSSSTALSQIHAQFANAIEEITNDPLTQGYNILETVGRSMPGAEGVRRVVEEIEHRKISLGNLCVAHTEENMRITLSLETFIEKQNDILCWLVSIAEAFLQGHQDMGSGLAMAQDFLQMHQQLLSDVQKKGVDINNLLLTLPPVIEVIKDEDRLKIDGKVESLHSHWISLKNLLEKRIDLAELYVKFHSLSVELASKFDDLEGELKKHNEKMDDEILNGIEQKWLHIQQVYSKLSGFGNTFIEEASKVGDPYLDIKRACLCVETVLEHFGGQHLTLSQSWETLESSITVEREFRILWDKAMADSSKTLEWSSKLEQQLYPVLTSDTSSSKIILRELEDKLQVILAEFKRAQSEIEFRVKNIENLILKGADPENKHDVINKLKEIHTKLQMLSTEYQILVQMLISFFKNLAELEKTIENLESQYKHTRLPTIISDVEVLLKEHEASRQAVFELFKFTQNEKDQIIECIKQQEPQSAGEKDIEQLTRLLEIKKIAWESAWTDRKLQIEQHRQVRQFDSDLQQMNTTINDLSKQLEGIKGQYGESLTSANAMSTAFVYFERTIELLEVRLQTFMNTTEKMLTTDPVSSPQIHMDLRNLQSKWDHLLKQVAETRSLINLSMKYFTLVEEAEEWFREGSRLLVTIARKSTAVKTPSEATELLNEVEMFLKPGEKLQDERIKNISALSMQLYGNEKSKKMGDVLQENKEMLDSFTIISDELSTLAKNLRASEEQKLLQEKEQQVANENLAAARAEAAAAQAAAAAAEEARKAAESAARILQETSVKKVDVEMQVAFQEFQEGGVLHQSPIPVSKKIKLSSSAIPPSFEIPLHDAVIQEGEKFTFECRVHGDPLPEVVWYKDGISIQNNPDYQTTYCSGHCTLTIEETFAEDSARFICKATNTEGSAETSATLSVKESEPEEQLMAPKFTKKLEPGTAKEGSTYQFQCKVEGIPLPVVQWLKNDKCIDNSPDYVITYNNGEAILQFEEVFLEDQAEYSCKATNQVGSETSSARLIIEPLEPTEAPLFITPLTNVMARAGQKIKLECEIQGLPIPQIQWSHNNKIVKDTRDLKIQYDECKASLIVNEAFPKDAGIYVVTATNIAGEASSSCNVSVKGRLPTETSDSELASDMEPTKPSIQLSLKDVSVFEGKRVRLDCVIVGQPEPEVIWYHNDRPVKESEDFQLLFQGDRCSLIIKEVYIEDAGDYKVVAINSGGEASSKCTLAVQSINATEPAIRSQQVEVLQTGTIPKFSKLLTDILATEGEPVTLECCVTGNPWPNITWLHFNEEITFDERKQSNCDETGNVSLKLTSVTPEDKGVYTVKARNSLGEVKCFSNLIVKSTSSTDLKSKTEKLIHPAFKELFADRTVIIEDSTKFDCIVLGKPTPKVKWLFNNVPVSGKDFLVSTSGERQVLMIPRVSKSHCGQISCVAENEVGKATCVATLTVQEGPDLSTFESCGVMETDHQSFSMKRSVFMQSSSSQFTSTVSGQGEPKSEFHKVTSESEHSLQHSNNKPPVQVQSQKTVEMHQINQEKPETSESTYLKVSNMSDDAQDSSASSYSTPVASPKPLRKSVGPRFISPLNGKIVDQGNDVILEGIVDGYPSPEVTWTKNNQPLCPIENKVMISWELNKARLELKNVTVKDAGRYTCTAENKAGSARSTADLVVKKTTFPPVFGRRLQAQIVKSGDRVIMEIEVTGTPDPEISWFKENQQIFTGPNYRIKIQGNSHSLIIEKATLDYSGRYMVVAKNSVGEARSTADFVVCEPDQSFDVTSHTTYFEDEMESRVQRKTHLESSSTKIESELIEPLKNTSNEVTSNILKPPSVGELVTVTEMSKTEKIISVKMDHNMPAQSSSDLKSVNDVSVSINHEKPLTNLQIPVQVEIKTKNNDASSDIKEFSNSERSDNENVESVSISKQSAYDFFVSKLSEEAVPQPKVLPSDEMLMKGTVKAVAKNFDDIESKENEIQKHVKKVLDHAGKVDSMLVVKTEQRGTSEHIHNADFHSKPKFASSGTQVEKHVENVLEETKTTLAKELQELSILPEPPPELGFIPKSEIPGKIRQDVTTRVKKLEESHRILTPVEIPLGGVKIFPTVAKKEVNISVMEKCQQPNENICPEPIIKKEVQEEVCVQKKVVAPGVLDWSYPSIKPAELKQHKTDLIDFQPYTKKNDEIIPVTSTIDITKLDTQTETTKTFTSHSFSSEAPTLLSTSTTPRATSPRPSAEGIAMEKLWVPQKPTDASVSYSNVKPSGLNTSESDSSHKPSMEGLAMDKIWAHKHPDSALKKSWPPPQTIEEKPVIPWVSKQVSDKSWSSTEGVKKVPPLKESKQIQIEPNKSTLGSSNVFQSVQTTETSTEETSTLHDKMTISTPLTDSENKNVIHYIAEARVIHSPQIIQSDFVHSETTFTENKSEIFESIEKIGTLQESHIIEENVLKPSQLKKSLPPYMKEDTETQIHVKQKAVKTDSFQKPYPLKEMCTEPTLIPGPPPEIGFAPPPLERRQSHVESIEQDLKKDLIKEPSKCIVGAVRTIPLPPTEERILQSKEKVCTKLTQDLKAANIDIKPVSGKPFERFPDLEPFPFKPENPKAKPTKCLPPPKPSKFVKGELWGSDYESDLESVSIVPKWRPYESDSEDFAYRKVNPPSLKLLQRAKSTEPEPLPPSKFDIPPQFHGPPRPSVKIQQKDICTVTSEKKESKLKLKSNSTTKTELKKPISPPPLKPGSPPIFVEVKPQETKFPVEQKKENKPDSPKSKTKIARTDIRESGYMADTDEPRHLRQISHKSTNIKHEETTIEHTSVITENITHSIQSSSQLQQKNIDAEKVVPLKQDSPSKIHHRHSEYKTEKKTAIAAADTSAKRNEEFVTSTVVKEGKYTSHASKDERESSLEPFPLKSSYPSSATKPLSKYPPPSPSKFMKGDFRESDYESDYECRIVSKWRPSESDADEPTYRPVRPILTPRINSQASLSARTPTPPSEFDNPPHIGGPPRPKFEPIDKISQTNVSHTMKSKDNQRVVKPTPVTPKSSSDIEVIIATPAIREQPPIVLKPGSPPILGYIPPPRSDTTNIISHLKGATQTETSKVMKFAEATDYSRRVVSVQQTTKIIKFGDGKDKSEQSFIKTPLKSDTERNRRSSAPPPVTPKKFVPGEFRESDYESDYEGPIKARWTPGGSDTDEPKYRKVKPPNITRSTSVPTRSKFEFDAQPPFNTCHKPCKENQQAEHQNVSQKQRTENKHLVSSAKSNVSGLQKEKRSEIGFDVTSTSSATAANIASKHMSEMTSTFKSKAKQFVDDIITDVNIKKLPKDTTPMLKDDPSANIITPNGDSSPQAYREESRVSEFGTKHIDPDTGLIYFKYDFGYEFGVVLPGEGKTDGSSKNKMQVPSKSEKQVDAIEFPVIHEKTTKHKGPPIFKPKKNTHSKSVKWEPPSESELSEAESDFTLHKKRLSLPAQPTTVHIVIPGSTPSPLSLSPSLPSLSPYQTMQLESAGDTWSPLSPNKNLRAQLETTPYSTPGSTPSSTPVPASQHPRKTPIFITPLRDIAVKSGQTARFECIVQAEPTPNILWSKNGRIIENSQDYQIMYRNGVCRLTIPKAFPEDAGNYTCTATNMLGTVTTSGSLDVPGERRSVYK